MAKKKRKKKSGSLSRQAKRTVAKKVKRTVKQQTRKVTKKAGLGKSGMSTESTEARRRLREQREAAERRADPAKQREWEAKQRQKAASQELRDKRKAQNAATMRDLTGRVQSGELTKAQAKREAKRRGITVGKGVERRLDQAATRRKKAVKRERDRTKREADREARAAKPKQPKPSAKAQTSLGRRMRQRLGGIAATAPPPAASAPPAAGAPAWDLDADESADDYDDDAAAQWADEMATADADAQADHDAGSSYTYSISLITKIINAITGR